jgi:hypothetical protein
MHLCAQKQLDFMAKKKWEKSNLSSKNFALGFS